MLLALLADEVRALRWEFERANFKGKPKRPEPIPRPGITAADTGVEKTVIGAGDGFDTIEDFRAWYEGVRKTSGTS